MTDLSERERISLLIMEEWSDQQRGINKSCDYSMKLFAIKIRFSKTIIVRTIQRFEKSGSVRNRPKSGRPVTATNENKTLDVLQSFVEPSYFYKLRRTTT